jgi:hypothetical protein
VEFHWHGKWLEPAGSGIGFAMIDREQWRVRALQRSNWAKGGNPFCPKMAFALAQEH